MALKIMDFLDIVGVFFTLASAGMFISPRDIEFRTKVATP